MRFVLLFALLLASCLDSSDEPSRQEVAEVPSGAQPIPTWDSPDPGEPGEAAAIEGVLRGDASVDGGCLWLEQSPSGKPSAVLWPEGFGARFDPVQLIGPDGEVVAQEGDTIIASGGEHPSTDGRCLLGQESVLRLNSVPVVERTGGG
jgi:hypothetical protein